MEVGEKKDWWEKSSWTCSVWLLMVVSMILGGVVLWWWDYKHHATNTQLWMVPFGLVLFATPLLVCLSLFFSDLCDHHHTLPMAGQLNHDLENQYSCEQIRINYGSESLTSEVSVSGLNLK